MKITLAKKEMFWGLSHPLNCDKMLLWLSKEEPTITLVFEEMSSWAKSMIRNSVIAGHIVADPDPTVEIVQEEVAKPIEEKPVVKKKATRKKATKKTKKKVQKKV